MNDGEKAVVRALARTYRLAIGSLKDQIALVELRGEAPETLLQEHALRTIAEVIEANTDMLEEITA